MTFTIYEINPTRERGRREWRGSVRKRRRKGRTLDIAHL